MATDEHGYRSVAELFEAYARHVSPGKVALFQSAGLDGVMGARQGATFQDLFSARRWLNCHCNGGVFNLGHRHPAVVAALRAALEHLDVGNHHLVSPHRARLAERLAATTGGHLPGVVFAVGGGEAIDLAIKVARGVSGRHQIVSVCGGYHGHTGLALAAGDAQYREPFGPNLPGFSQVPFGDLDALAGAIGGETAAVLIEPVPATLGMPIPAPGYLAGVQRLCQQRGALLVVDEVQTGLGRTGRLWACEHEGVEPDMLVTGKGLGGGLYPIAATLMTAPLLAFFRQHPFIHISTFGGAELGCAAALAALDVVEAPGFLERVRALSERFGHELEGLPCALRRRGLMMALKFPVEGAGLMAAKMLFDAGVFAVWANNDTSALQLLPPLTIGDDEVGELCAILRRTFA